MHIAARPLLIAGFFLAGPALAQEPVYKCDGRTYSHAPCGPQLNPPGRVVRTYDSPSQARARQMNRAMLPAETRERCEALETAIAREEARLRAKAAGATEAELGDLAIQRVNYREMRC